MNKYIIKKLSFIILLILMVIPFYVNAETCDTNKVSISSITTNEKSDNVEELQEATANGRNINLNLSMSEVGDNIEYKIIVKNDSSEDYALDKNSFNISSDYIDYTLESEDNSNIVKANSSKTIYLKVEYKNEVPEEAFESGTFNENKTMIVQLSNDDTKNVLDIITNPKTGVYSGVLIIAVLLLISIVLYVMFRKKKYIKFMILIIGTAIIIPISAYALCKCDITIDSNITINQTSKCGSFARDNWNTIVSNVQSKDNNSCYEVGDTKEIDMGNLGVHTLRIANMSTPDECSNEGFSQTACGFVLEFADIITTHRMNPFSWNNYSSGNGNIGGWPASEMRTYVNNDIYNALPDALKNAIINTTVVSGHGNRDSNNFTSTDKLYLLSPIEVWGIDKHYSPSSDTDKDYSRTMDYYIGKNRGEVVKQYNNSNYFWWLRTPMNWGYSSFFGIDYYGGGTYSQYYSNETYGVSPAFRLA